MSLMRDERLTVARREFGVTLKERGLHLGRIVVEKDADPGGGISDSLNLVLNTPDLAMAAGQQP